MASDEMNLFPDREEVLAGSPARRADILLFLIESRTAHLLAQSRRVMERFVTEDDQTRENWRSSKPSRRAEIRRSYRQSRTSNATPGCGHRSLPRTPRYEPPSPIASGRSTASPTRMRPASGGHSGSTIRR